MVVTPIKYLFDLHHLHKCRKKPFNELLLQEVARDQFSDCAIRCRPAKGLGKRLDKIIESLPYCTNKTGEECFDRVLKRIEPTILEKPCTKLQYKAQMVSYKSENDGQKVRDGVRILRIIPSEFTASNWLIL